MFFLIEFVKQMFLHEHIYIWSQPSPGAFAWMCRCGKVDTKYPNANPRNFV